MGPWNRSHPPVRLAAIGSGILALLFPTVAAACATCMNDPARQKSIPILLGFIGVPFLVAGGLFVLFRQSFKK